VQTSWLLKLTLACLLTAAEMVAWLLMTSAPFGSLNYNHLLLQRLGALGVHVIKCWGWYFMSMVEMTMVGL
jgi:hypothetical protein